MARMPQYAPKGETHPATRQGTGQAQYGLKLMNCASAKSTSQDREAYDFSYREARIYRRSHAAR